MTKARYIADRDEWCNAEEDGSFTLGVETPTGRALYYTCPCGCGCNGRLWIGENFKPVDAPSWNWNGSTDAATLTPSVNHVDHWHGWLTCGEWNRC